ncbi:formin-like protein 1 [Chaetodon trifascialis]|uniref:formin-like protein 1 n=1 Tax=Chaetodon trifascialis TaxID=109706 RepID=UPI003993F4F1
MPSTSLSPNITAASPSVTNLVPQKQNAEQSPSQSQSTHDKEELSMPLLPPPPEFDDLEEIMERPPSTPPPDPPMKKAPAPAVSPLLPAQVPAPPPKPKLPAAPKWPPLNNDVKLKPPVQEKPKVAPSQLPSNLSTSQTTLLSILQKKMLEMDHKIAPVKEAESSSDDWGTSFSEGDSEVSVFPRATPQSKNYPVVNKAATLDMRELEGKVGKKCQMSSTQVPTSNGLQSKHQYGMTFTVRPGTKQPITLVSKGESQ